jgi:hypothetical protein
MECSESEGKRGEDFQRGVTKIGNVLTALNLRLAARQFHRKKVNHALGVIDFCATTLTGSFGSVSRQSATEFKKIYQKFHHFIHFLAV